MFQPQGLARAQLTPEQCAFFVHPTYANASYTITNTYTTMANMQTCGSLIGQMYTPDGIAVIGFTSAWYVPANAQGFYMGLRVDAVNDYLTGYLYFNGSGWGDTLCWTYVLRGLDRHKKHIFQPTFGMSSNGMSGTLYHGNGGYITSFWGTANLMQGKEWHNGVAQKENVV